MYAVLMSAGNPPESVAMEPVVETPQCVVLKLYAVVMSAGNPPRSVAMEPVVETPSVLQGEGAPREVMLQHVPGSLCHPSGKRRRVVNRIVNGVRVLQVHVPNLHLLVQYVLYPY